MHESALFKDPFKVEGELMNWDRNQSTVDRNNLANSEE